MRKMKINVGDILKVQTTSLDSWMMIVRVLETISPDRIYCLVIYDNEKDGLCWSGTKITLNTEDLDSFKVVKKLTKSELVLEMLQ